MKKLSFVILYLYILAAHPSVILAQHQTALRKEETMRKADDIRILDSLKWYAPLSSPSFSGEAQAPSLSWEYFWKFSTTDSCFNYFNTNVSPKRLMTRSDLNNYANAFLSFNDHNFNFDNPHQVTAAQVGLGNVNNTSDMNKPVSIPMRDSLRAALQGYERSFPKNTAFNKNFGTTAGTIVQGNDSRLFDSRTPNGIAGGSLVGTYPNPTLAANVVLPGNPVVEGNLRLKGASNYGNKLFFGDGEYVYLHEAPDDKLTIKASEITLQGYSRASNPTTTDNSTQIATTAYVHTTNILTNPNIIYVYVVNGECKIKSSNVTSVEYYSNSSAGIYYYYVNLSISVDQYKILPFLTSVNSTNYTNITTNTITRFMIGNVNPTTRLLVYSQNDDFSFIGYIF